MKIWSGSVCVKYNLFFEQISIKTPTYKSLWWIKIKRSGICSQGTYSLGSLRQKQTDSQKILGRWEDRSVNIGCRGSWREPGADQGATAAFLEEDPSLGDLCKTGPKLSVHGYALVTPVRTPHPGSLHASSHKLAMLVAVPRILLRCFLCLEFSVAKFFPIVQWPLQFL